jgi:predicted GNAT family N-acyltransferase
MIFAENIARDLGYRKSVHACPDRTAVGFYQKLGYSINGEEFMEVTIPHYVMEKSL